MRKMGNWRPILLTIGSRSPPTHWRFFLRPGFIFIMDELEMEDVITSLQRSNALPLFSHIERIDSPTAWTLDIHLRQPDRWLPWLSQVPP